MIKKVVSHTDPVAALHATPEGLWLGHAGGLTFFDPAEGSSQSWTTADGLPAHPVGAIDSAGKRLVVATPNGVAWLDDRAGAVSGSAASPWHRALTHPRGAGVHVNGVTLSDGRIYATTGGGRIYFEGDAGFQLLELPLQQARLLRVLPLPCGPRQRRLLIVTNNSGVLLLATGEDEDPSLYQWGEAEGLMSRYVTAALVTDEEVFLGVHGGMHVARIEDLVRRPETLTSWEGLVLSGVSGPAEQKRVQDLARFGEDVFAATTSGLYRLTRDPEPDGAVTTRRIEEAPTRFLAVHEGRLWAVHNNQLGYYEPGSDRTGATAARRLRGQAGSAATGVAHAVIHSFGTRWRFQPEPRWRSPGSAPVCRTVMTIRSTELGLAIGSEAGRFALLHAGRWSTEVVARMRRPPEVLSIVLDPDSGNLWATLRHGLFQRNAPERWIRDAGFPGRNVQTLQVWNHSVLALGNNGLYEYAQGAWSAVVVDGDSPALAVSAARDDILALADRAGSALYLWPRGDARPHRRAAAIGRANCMAWDAQRLWIGTDRGLLRWEDGRLERLTWDEDADNRIAALVVRGGTLLAGTAHGVWQAPLEALRQHTGAGLEAIGTRLGLLDGLPDLQVTCMAVHEEEVWVGTPSGLAVLG